MNEPNIKKRGRPRAIPNCTCCTCNTPLTRSKSLLKRNSRSFCSHTCRASFYAPSTINTPDNRKKRAKLLSGRRNPKWNEGRSQSNQTTLVRDPFHNRAWKNGYVPLKYLYAEHLLNRPLRRNELVFSEHEFFEDDDPPPTYIYLGKWHLHPNILYSFEA